MNHIPTNTLIVIAVLFLAVIAVVGWVVIQRQRSVRLKQRFGPEYGHAVKELGSQAKAESELQKREERMARLNITPLAPTDAARFAQAWKALQSRFIDNPKGVVADADELVRELMLKRGYPMGDFERRTADISVDHPSVVAAYRSAQAIAARDKRGEADTEELRMAVVHYRTLFDELLEVTPAKVAATPVERGVAVHS
jgi:hypothetical protein